MANHFEEKQRGSDSLRTRSTLYIQVWAHVVVLFEHSSHGGRPNNEERSHGEEKVLSIE